MRIADAASRTGTSTRLLRYYEEQGLICPARTSTGYRDYSESDVQTIGQIRLLLDAGLSTATIGKILPCLQKQSGYLPKLCPQLAAELRHEQQRIIAAIEALAASRDLIEEVINFGLGHESDR